MYAACTFAATNLIVDNPHSHATVLVRSVYWDNPVLRAGRWERLNLVLENMGSLGTSVIVDLDAPPTVDVQGQDIRGYGLGHQPSLKAYQSLKITTSWRPLGLCEEPSQEASGSVSSSSELMQRLACWKLLVTLVSLNQWSRRLCATSTSRFNAISCWCLLLPRMGRGQALRLVPRSRLTLIGSRCWVGMMTAARQWQTGKSSGRWNMASPSSCTIGIENTEMKAVL